VAAIITVVVAAIMGIRQLGNPVKARHAQLFMPLYDTFRNREFAEQYSDILFRHQWKDFDDWLHKYGPMENPTDFSSWVSVCSYFEGVGVLVKRKLIDIDLVDDLLSTEIRWLWEKIEPIAKEYRAQYNRPQLWEYFEYFYKEMRKRDEKKAFGK